jgi:hypothetical protein
VEPEFTVAAGAETPAELVDIAPEYPDEVCAMPL